MNDPNYNAVPPGHYANDEDEAFCPVCFGVLPGFVGFEGEYPCGCSDEDKDTYDTTEERDIDRDIDSAIDAEIDRVRLERKERMS